MNNINITNVNMAPAKTLSFVRAWDLSSVGSLPSRILNSIFSAALSVMLAVKASMRSLHQKFFARNIVQIQTSQVEQPKAPPRPLVIEEEEGMIELLPDFFENEEGQPVRLVSISSETETVVIPKNEDAEELVLPLNTILKPTSMAGRLAKQRREAAEFNTTALELNTLVTSILVDREESEFNAETARLAEVNDAQSEVESRIESRNIQKALLAAEANRKIAIRNRIVDGLCLAAIAATGGYAVYQNRDAITAQAEVLGSQLSAMGLTVIANLPSKQAVMQTVETSRQNMTAALQSGMEFVSSQIRALAPARLPINDLLKAIPGSTPAIA